MYAVTDKPVANYRIACSALRQFRLYNVALTRIGFHTLSNLLILGICTTIRFGSILPNAFLGVSQNVEA